MPLADGFHEILTFLESGKNYRIVIAVNNEEKYLGFLLMDQEDDVNPMYQLLINESRQHFEGLTMNEYAEKTVADMNNQMNAFFAANHPPVENPTTLPWHEQMFAILSKIQFVTNPEGIPRIKL